MQMLEGDPRARLLSVVLNTEVKSDPLSPRLSGNQPHVVTHYL